MTNFVDLPYWWTENMFKRDPGMRLHDGDSDRCSAFTVWDDIGFCCLWFPPTSMIATSYQPLIFRVSASFPIKASALPRGPSCWYPINALGKEIVNILCTYMPRYTQIYTFLRICIMHVRLYKIHSATSVFELLRWIKAFAFAAKSRSPAQMTLSSAGRTNVNEFSRHCSSRRSLSRVAVVEELLLVSCGSVVIICQDRLATEEDHETWQRDFALSGFPSEWLTNNFFGLRLPSCSISLWYVSPLKKKAEAWFANLLQEKMQACDVHVIFRMEYFSAFVATFPSIVLFPLKWACASFGQAISALDAGTFQEAMESHHQAGLHHTGRVMIPYECRLLWIC